MLTVHSHTGPYGAGAAWPLQLGSSLKGAGASPATPRTQSEHPGPTHYSHALPRPWAHSREDGAIARLVQCRQEAQLCVSSRDGNDA